MSRYESPYKIRRPDRTEPPRGWRVALAEPVRDARRRVSVLHGGRVKWVRCVPPGAIPVERVPADVIGLRR